MTIGRPRLPYEERIERRKNRNNSRITISVFLETYDRLKHNGMMYESMDQRINRLLDLEDEWKRMKQRKGAQ